MITKIKPGTNNALKTIRKQFPQVKKVVDARVGITIKVTEKNNSRARKKDPHSCALANACIEKHIADACIIGITTSYLIKGNKATRYKTTNTVGREITSFDRHHDFQPGIYALSPISPANRLGQDTRKKRPSGSHPKRMVHKTANIRELIH